MNWNSNKLESALWLANGIMLAIIVNLVSSIYFFRWDMTAEGRYTIQQPTKALLTSLEEEVYVEVFLEGELNAGFKRLQRATREMLEEFRVASGNRLHYEFSDPAVALSQQARTEFMGNLAAKGISPMNVIENQGGERVERLVFPGALVSYGGFEKGVMLLKGNRAQSAEEQLNQSIEGLEFELASAVFQLTNTDRKRVGLVVGHGELDSLEIAGFNNALLDRYDVFKVDLERKAAIENCDALVVAKPRRAFSEQDKLKLDQYVMRGGRLMFLIDKMDAVMDSASRENYFAFPYTLNLDDLFFKYGVRINNDLVQDRIAARYPIITGNVGNKPQITPMDWPFFPLANHYADHPVTRNLDAALLRFASSIDTVRATGIKKTPLFFSSAASQKLGTPVKISVNDLRKNPGMDAFGDGGIPFAYLLEGNFTSLYKGRFLPTGFDTMHIAETGLPAKIIIVADGDVARNEVNHRTGQPQQLGFDPLSGYTFANQDLLLNMMAYLMQDDGLIMARNREIKIRPLDKKKIAADRAYWQFVNLVAPVVMLLVYGLLRVYFRKRKFTNFESSATK